MISLIPRDIIISDKLQLMSKMGYVTIITLILTFIVVFLMSKRIARPITSLANQMEHVQNFELDNVTGVHSSIREVQHMSGAFLAAVSGLKSFNRYVPADLVRGLVEDNREAHIGGEKKRLAIMFTDISNFSTLSEDMDPVAVTLQLSEYFEVISHIVTNYGGTIDKYLGDGVLAFWGAPIEMVNPSRAACEAALQCLKEINEINKAWFAYGKPEMHTRIGIHTGDVVVGNIGSDYHLEYTVIGDNVNVASRIEGKNKEFNTQILVSETTMRDSEDVFNYIFVGEHR